MSTRIRQSRSETNSPVSSQATSMLGAVSRPSRRLVTNRIGMRKIEGNNPKYVNCLPSWTKASTPSRPLGTHRWPWNMALACRS